MAEAIPPPAPLQPEDTPEAMLEAWRAAMKAEAQVSQMMQTLEGSAEALRSAQDRVTRLRQLLASIADSGSDAELGAVALEALAEHLDAERGILWYLSEDYFVPAEAYGFSVADTTSLFLAPPDPFPGRLDLPFRPQLFPMAALPLSLGRLLKAGQEAFFVPLEQESLLVGFAIFARTRHKKLKDGDQEHLDLLQRLFALSFHQRWLMRDLESQKTSLADQAEVLRAHAEALEQSQWAAQQGGSFKVEFLHFATDEMRRQLRELLVMVKLGADGAYTEEELGPAMRDAYLAGRTLQAQLDDLLAFTEPEAVGGQVGSTVDLADIFEDLRQTVDRFPKVADFPIRWPEIVRGDSRILTDPDGLRKVLASLLVRALHHARLRPPVIHVAVEHGHRRIAVYIEEPGLVEANAALGALRVARPDEIALTGQGGAGLGLVLMQGALKRMNAGLQVAPAEGGAWVMIDLPQPD
ncbi:MAG: HAMP domain-containing histidine kinase [Holophagaceae bacterium]|nr:HAMP domain-containing histidine kinase [Holophagaceae bacterium]